MLEGMANYASKFLGSAVNSESAAKVYCIPLPRSLGNFK